MSTETDTTRVPNTLVAVVLAVLVGGALIYLVLNPPDPGSRAEMLLPPPGTPGHASTYEELLSEPDLIVVGTVESSTLGRSVGEDIPQVQFEETALRVDKVLAGSTIATNILIETDTIGVDYDRDWRKAGTRVLAFLWLKRDAESGGQYYRPITFEGVYVIDGSTLVQTINSPISMPLEGVLLTDAMTIVQDARSGVSP
ncbi:MAG: hypothetical protein ACE5F5_12030 [Acidimicrobiia bacterium]